MHFLPKAGAPRDLAAFSLISLPSSCPTVIESVSRFSCSKMIRSFMTGLLWHVTSCFWNVPAPLVTCWLFCILLQVWAWRLPCGTWAPATCSCSRLSLVISYTLSTLCDRWSSCCLSPSQESRTMCVSFTATYPESIIPLLACGSCIKICWVNEWNLYIHCIYAFGIAVFWNCWVNEGIVGKLSCGTETSWLTSQFGKLRKQHNITNGTFV